MLTPDEGPPADERRVQYKESVDALAIAKRGHSGVQSVAMLNVSVLAELATAEGRYARLLTAVEAGGAQQVGVIKGHAQELTEELHRQREGDLTCV